MEDMEKSTTSIQYSSSSLPAAELNDGIEIELNSYTESRPEVQMLDLNNKINPLSYSSKSHLSSTAKISGCRKNIFLHGKMIQRLSMQPILMISLVLDKRNIFVCFTRKTMKI